MPEVQHPRMTIVFYLRNTSQSEETMGLRSKDWEIVSDWCVWRFYVDIAPTQKQKKNSF